MSRSSSSHLCSSRTFLLYLCFLALLFLCLCVLCRRRSDCQLRRACRTDRTQILSMALLCIMVAVVRPLPYLPPPLLLLPSAVPVHSRTLLNGTVHQHLWATVQLRTGSLLSRYLPRWSCVTCAYFVRFEVSTAGTVKKGVFWDVTPCGSCKNRRFGGS
jgi:hypothetical protein